MRRLDYLHQVPTSKHPDGPACINGHVYELTYKEVEWLEDLKRLKDGGKPGEVISKVIYTGMNIKDVGVIDILKENIKELEELRNNIPKVVEDTEEALSISGEINHTVENLMTAYKLAGITQLEE